MVLFSNWSTPSVYCHFYFFALSGECAVSLDWRRNTVITVRNTLILDMTKPRKRVFHLSDLQTVVQQKLVSTIWSLFIETYTYIMLLFSQFLFKIQYEILPNFFNTSPNSSKIFQMLIKFCWKDHNLLINYPIFFQKFYKFLWTSCKQTFKKIVTFSSN